MATGTGGGIALLTVGIGATGLGHALTATPAVRLLLGLMGGLSLVCFGAAMVHRMLRAL